MNDKCSVFEDCHKNTVLMPDGINGLIDLDDETRAWLENNALETYYV